MSNTFNTMNDEIVTAMNEISIDNPNGLDAFFDTLKDLSSLVDTEGSNFMNMQFEEEKGTGNRLVKSDGYFILPFKQDKDSFMDSQVFVKFIKRVEYLVRNHPDYKSYISHLKNNGLNHCMILGDIEDEHCSIEMHHGPILNLFDYCTIITNHLIKTNGTCTTMEVADLVLHEHRIHNIQVIMLASSIHQMVEAQNCFINIRQSFGNLEKFINKYLHAISDSQRYVIVEYLKMCETTETNIDDFLNVRKSVRNWSLEN